MQPPVKRWSIPAPIPSEAEQELRDFHPILRRILYNRGYRTAAAARQFLEARPPSGTTPDRMAGMGEAVERVSEAIRRQEAVVVYGDYDADGVTATSLLVQALAQVKAKVRGYIPNRFDEGYGLNTEALTKLAEEGAKLVITVDCGIRSVIEAEHARSLGLDLIITDHHQPGEELPEVVALINPKLAYDTYPDKDLAGVGLAYKLASAIFNEQGIPETQMEEFLDLVAIGTVADMAPLTGENRALVRAGLEYIRNPQRQGVLSLIGVSGLRPANVSAGDIGYMLGPRLNAAGRLDSALAAFNLLSTSNPYEAARLAQELDNQNTSRQKLTREIQVKAEQLAFATNDNPWLLFAADADFNPGVVGLAASRLSEKYYRPSVVAARGPEYTRGSCRSIPEFHITNALDQCADLLHHYGGHAAAAGLTVHNDQLAELVQRLSELAEGELSKLDLRPEVKADAEVEPGELRPDLMRALDDLQPTGMGNRSALLFSRNVLVREQRAIGKDGAHMKMKLVDKVGFTHDAIAFRMGHLAGGLPNRVDVMFEFERNFFNGQESLQLRIKDIRPTESANPQSGT